MLEADREPDEVGRDAGRLLLGLVELLMGGRGRVDDQRLRVADVGEEAEELDAVDEPAAGLDAALDPERDDAAEATGQVALGELVDGCDGRPG